MRTLLRDYDIVSGATLDGFYLEIPFERDALQRKLEELGPFRLVGGPPCVACEVWRISKGRFIPAGFDRRSWSARWADTLDTLNGRWLGERGMFWRQLSRSVDEAFSVEPYHELVIAVPDVRFADEPTLYTLVLGMVTDSRLAMSLDWWGGYGYRKQLGAFEFDMPGEFRVTTDSESLLSGKVRRSPTRAGDLAWLDARWRQPLLGCVRPGSFSVSRLNRSIRANGCHAGSGVVELHDPSGVGLLSGLPAIRAHGTRACRVALFSDIATRISAPRRFEPRPRRRA